MIPDRVLNTPLEVLAEEMQACESCSLYQQTPRHISGIWTDTLKETKVMFIGEGPGKDEVEKGIPL